MSHATATRRPKKHHEEEHENHERWAVSYADMMTVLLALFIVLYAISVVDKTKFDELRESLAIGFGQQAPSQLGGSNGALDGVEDFKIGPEFTGLSGESAPDNPSQNTNLTEEAESYLAAVKEYEQLDNMEETIKAELEAQGLAANVEFLIDDRGLVVGMVGSDVFFKPDDAALTSTAQAVVDTLAGPLRNQSRQITVEGHANVLPSANYATNWELSSARATQVLRRFVEWGGVAGGQISAVGYGDARPVELGLTDEALSANRRVDIVVHSSASEEVRALLPRIAAAIIDGTISQEEINQQVEAAAGGSDGATASPKPSP